jgi:hypothetical protein
VGVGDVDRERFARNERREARNAERLSSTVKATAGCTFSVPVMSLTISVVVPVRVLDDVDRVGARREHRGVEPRVGEGVLRGDAVAVGDLEPERLARPERHERREGDHAAGDREVDGAPATLSTRFESCGWSTRSPRCPARAA